jgi:WD40 repeat protein
MLMNSSTYPAMLLHSQSYAAEPLSIRVSATLHKVLLLLLLSGSLDRTVRLWDLKYGMPLSISRPHGSTVRSVALDAQLVASGSSDNVVRLWHARNATEGSSLLDPAAAAEAAALLEVRPTDCLVVRGQ